MFLCTYVYGDENKDIVLLIGIKNLSLDKIKQLAIGYSFSISAIVYQSEKRNTNRYLRSDNQNPRTYLIIFLSKSEMRNAIWKLETQIKM
jgi:hypothetical protein